MAQVQGIPYRRHGPSAALREFLDPLDPGDYFDCGRARLHGLDDALLDEARSRGREVGDDAFLLVATDSGLFFCRPSIAFVISARWDEIAMIRPRGRDPVVLPITWPRHGELKFTVSKRLAGNIFRRWLQLRMQARRNRQTGPHPLPVRTGPVEEIDLDLDAIEELVSADDVDTDPPFPLLDGDDDRIGVSPSNPEDHRSAGDDDPVDQVDPTPVPAETSDGLPFLEPVGGPSDTGSLADDQLERVTVPRTTRPTPSWVGSAVSLAASLVVISTVVLIATVSVSVWRGASGASTSATSTEMAGAPTTIDHERFRSSSDPVGQLDADQPGEIDAGSAGLAPSSAGGASQSIPSSSQQLLAVPADGPGSEPVDPDAAPRCSSNYSGCIPDVDHTAGADVDCVGEGDGPFFADTEVLVLGDDIYGLDTDGDRVACEADQSISGPLSTGSPVGTGEG